MAAGRGGDRLEPFTQNFQREVQAFLFLLQWRQISQAELRKNLRKMGVELDDDPLNLPKFPPLNFELPEEDDEEVYPAPEAEGEPMVADEVVLFIDANRIPASVYQNFEVEAFMSLDNFTKALNSQEVSS